MNEPRTCRARHGLVALLLTAALTGCGVTAAGTRTSSAGTSPVDSSAVDTTAVDTTSASAGTTDDRFCPALVSATLSYARGSVAPPWHYEWTIELAGERGTMTMQGGYNDQPRWERALTLDRDALTTLCRTATAFADTSSTEPGGVGGDTATVVLTSQAPDAPAETVKGSVRDPQAFEKAVRASIPTDVWAGLAGSFQQWSRAEQERQDGTGTPVTTTSGGSGAPSGVCAEAATGIVQYIGAESEGKQHREWTLTFGGGRAELMVTPGYGNTLQYRASWMLDPAALSALCTFVLDPASAAPHRTAAAAGSPGLWVRITSSLGTFDSADRDTAGAAAQLDSTLRQAVPEQVWQQTMTQWQAWSDKQK